MEVCKKSAPSTCCKPCRSEYYKERYAKRKADPSYTTKVHKGVTAASKRNELRKIIYEHYQNNPCTICGEARIACLQLDHLRDKKAKVSSLVSSAASKEALIEEMAKCRVLCANCHAVHTAEQFGWYSWREE